MCQVCRVSILLFGATTYRTYPFISLLSKAYNSPTNLSTRRDFVVASTRVIIPRPSLKALTYITYTCTLILNFVAHLPNYHVP